MNPKGASAAHHCRGSFFLAIFLILLHVHQEADNSVPRIGPELSRLIALPLPFSRCHHPAAL